MTTSVATADVATSSRPPLWLVICTAAAALLILVLAVAETSIKAAYLVDTRGEFISLFGVAFILVAGVHLWRRQRLYASLPLVLPWLLYPIVTQGDQIIDHLSITSMRVICHVLLAAIFAAPVAVVVLGARALFPARLSRRGAAVATAALFAAEIWLAQLYLGRIMIAVQIVMALAALVAAALPESKAARRNTARGRSERFALVVLMAGVAVSLGTYFGYRNAHGAYQGSPSFVLDPAQQAAAYPFDRIPLSTESITVPSAPHGLAAALDMDITAIDRLFQAYHLLNRNYTWDYHNELFLRQTPLVANYRAAGLTMVTDARRLYLEGDARTAAARSMLAPGDPLGALLAEVQAYMRFLFGRAPVIERMSAGFERTKAGLQHAAHLYEGETKYVGIGLNEILIKHARTVDAPALQPVTRTFATTSRRIYDAYADHIVGF